MTWRVIAVDKVISRKDAILFIAAMLLLLWILDDDFLCARLNMTSSFSVLDPSKNETLDVVTSKIAKIFYSTTTRNSSVIQDRAGPEIGFLY